MQYTIQNDHLAVTADTHGAELVSVVSKSTGTQMLWNADPKVWNRHAPILFPYAGKLQGSQYRLDGETYTGGGHGFARDSEFTAVEVTPEKLSFCLIWNEDTLRKFPRKFRLTVSYTLSGKTVQERVEVANLDEKELRFGLGYHPGFMLPFDDQHTTEDYELRFDTPQSPDEVLFESAFMTHNTRPYMKNSTSIALNDRMFDNDSICLQGLTAKTVSLTEKDTGRSISIDLTGFPYFIFWSSPNQEKLQFLCLEPWHTHPDMTDSDGDWNHKACAAELAPQEHWISNLNITFDR